MHPHVFFIWRWRRNWKFRAFLASTLPTELLPQPLEGMESDLIIIIKIRVAEEGCGLGQNLWLPLLRLWPPVFYTTMIFTSSFSSAR